MSDPREALVALIEDRAVWLISRAQVNSRDIADAILAEFDVTPQSLASSLPYRESDGTPGTRDHNEGTAQSFGDMAGHAYRVGWSDGYAEGRAHTVKPSVEDVARAILMVTQVADVDPDYAWSVQYPEVQDELLDQARAVLALLPGRSEAEVRREAAEEAWGEGWDARHHYDERGGEPAPSNPHTKEANRG